ncbi:MAG: arginine--tRNA ligase [Bacteroidota bacterium]
MQFKKKLQKLIQKAIQQMYDFHIPIAELDLTPTPSHFLGSHTLTTFPLAKALQKNPEKIATEIKDWLLVNSKDIVGCQVIKGFLNVTFADKLWLSKLGPIKKHSEKALATPAKNILIEFSQPNTNKPQHLGHLRNNFLGHALAEIMKAVGHKVCKVNIINDRGIHICKSMIAYQKWGNNQTPASTGIKGDHFVGKYYVLFEKAYQKQVEALADELGDKEKAATQAPLLKAAQSMLQKWELGDKKVLGLWEKMNNWVYEGFQATYEKIHISFDQVDYESKIYLDGKKIVSEGLEKGIFYQKENAAIWVDLQPEGLDQKLLLRSDGTSVYITQDIGLIEKRYQTHQFEKHIYVVGNEQNYHFKALFAIMKKLQKPYANHLEHLAYGMVNLPQGKMKSREGTTVDADNLIADMIKVASQQTSLLGKTKDFTASELHQLHHLIALGALKYFLLKINPEKNILFDPQTSIDMQGNTGPFIQYTYARIHTMLSKTSPTEFDLEAWEQDDAKLAPEEQAIVTQLVHFNDTLQQAAATYNPALLCQYAYELAKAYNRLYANLPIRQEKNAILRTTRLYISAHTAHTLQHTMHLLGIHLPERM